MKRGAGGDSERKNKEGCDIASVSAVIYQSSTDVYIILASAKKDLFLLSFDSTESEEASLHHVHIHSLCTYTLSNPGNPHITPGNLARLTQSYGQYCSKLAASTSVILLLVFKLQFFCLQSADSMFQ